MRIMGLLLFLDRLKKVQVYQLKKVDTKMIDGEVLQLSLQDIADIVQIIDKKPTFYTNFTIFAQNKLHLYPIQYKSK
jgi:hypothetical protein